MKTVERIDAFLAAIGMVCLFAIAIIIAIDGLGRHFLNSPIVGAYVLVEEYLMVAMIFLTLGYTWAKNGHISVNLFYDKMPPLIQNGAYLITILFGLLIVGLIGYTGIDTTVDAIVGNKTTSGLIRWPLWASYIWMPLGCAVFCMRLIVELVQFWKHIVGGGLRREFRGTGGLGHDQVD